MEKYNELIKLLESISKISFKKSNKNFFEVAGYPHYENVISNILSFFLKDDEHGLKDLWLKSLLECYVDSSKIIINDLDKYINIYDVRREVKTKDDSRIDLLIQTNDFMVIIENKIFSSVHNPFESYHLYATSEDNSIPIYEILLTLKKENNQIDKKKGYAFYNITYSKLIKKVRKNMGTYISKCNDKWLIYMKEFINNIESLESGYNMENNKELNRLIEQNNDLFADFFDTYYKEIESRISLIQAITKRFNELTNNQYNAYDYNTTLKLAKGSSYCSSVIDLKKDNNTIVIETYVMKINSKQEYERGNILYVALWNRFKKNYDFTQQLSMIKDIDGLDKLKEINSPGWGKHYILKEYNLSKDFGVDEVINLIKDIISVIK